MFLRVLGLLLPRLPPLSTWIFSWGGRQPPGFSGLSVPSIIPEARQDQQTTGRKKGLPVLPMLRNGCARIQDQQGTVGERAAQRSSKVDGKEKVLTCPQFTVKGLRLEGRRGEGRSGEG